MLTGEVHTNTIANFRSLCKQEINGIYDYILEISA